MPEDQIDAIAHRIAEAWDDGGFLPAKDMERIINKTLEIMRRGDVAVYRWRGHAFQVNSFQANFPITKLLPS